MAGFISGLRGGINEECYGELVRAVCDQGAPKQRPQKSPIRICTGYAPSKRVACRWHYHHFSHVSLLRKPAGEANFAQTLISTACTLTEAANKNNARKVKKRWTVGESWICHNPLIINTLQAHSPCSVDFATGCRKPRRWPALKAGVIFLRVQGRA